MMNNTRNAIVLVILVVVQLLFHGLAFGGEKGNYGNATVTSVTSIYDGDTFRANIAGWPDIIGHRIGIRINGIDTPEIKGKCKDEKILARKAKQFTVTALRSAQYITLKNIKRGKYYRIIADVYVDGSNLAELLLKNQLARAYHGEKRQSWCTK